MAYRFSKASMDKLVGVHPDLVRVLIRAIGISKQDFSVNEGVRTPERQKELYAQGRTKPGNIVTWTMNSNHFKHKDGFGHAVDLITYPVDYSNTKGFLLIRDAVMTAAKELGIHVRWGGDWNENGVQDRGETDIGHFELSGAHYS